jgi:phage gp36-like protein
MGGARYSCRPIFYGEALVGVTGGSSPSLSAHVTFFMMIYSTLASLVSEMSLPILQQLAPWATGDQLSGEYFVAEVSNTLVDAVEGKAIGELYGYLRGIYTITLIAPVDPLVVQTINELMHYQLYKQRDGANLPDKIGELYKGAVKRMQSIQKREIVLDAALAVEDSDQPTSFQFISPAAKFPSGFTSSF